MMIYTLGEIKNYERYFAEQGIPRKGINGSVWETFKEAQKYTNKDFRVYGILADWDKDTKPNGDSDADWHDLMIEAPLVRLGHIILERIA